jgi:hypothetical protein
VSVKNKRSVEYVASAIAIFLMIVLFHTGEPVSTTFSPVNTHGRRKKLQKHLGCFCIREQVSSRVENNFAAN